MKFLDRKNKFSLFTALYLAASSIIFHACTSSKKTEFDKLTANNVGSWSPQQSSMTEVWYARTPDSTCAYSYFFNDKGDSMYISSTCLYKNGNTMLLSIYTHDGKEKYYVYNKMENNYFVFKANSNYTFPNIIKYKLRDANSKVLESYAEGINEGKRKVFNFKMYKVD